MKQSPVRWESLVEGLSPFRGGLLRRLGLDAASKRIHPGRPAAPLNGIFLFLLCAFLLFSCTPSTPQPTPHVVTVYSTFAAQPWLPPLYVCAGTSSVISRVDDPSAADIILRMGEPEILVSSAYQIDTDEILIVTHRQSPVQNLALDEARALFAGRGDPSVQVWVYAPEADMQIVFDQVLMGGSRVSPSARLAVNPQQMSEILVNEPNTVGILPRHWKVGDIRDIYLVATVPVLAITQNESGGVIKELLACLQK
jgi:hypothetical protein